MRLVSTLLGMTGSLAFAAAATLEPIPLWPDGAPGALGEGANNIPTLTVFLPKPEVATGAAVVVCPGGGYLFHAPHEGAGYAEWLARNGIAGIVLKYRLGTHGYRHPIPFRDLERAVRLTRAMAGEWKIDPKRVGVMGSSAGGHLSATLLTRFDRGKPDAEDPVERQSSRPDLGILCYPVITMGEHTHEGSRDALLGEDAPADMVEKLSNEKHVTADTPPCFIWHTWEDPSVKVENALEFAAALRKAGVPFDLHVYQKGIHGIGLYGTPDAPAGSPELPWARACLDWLKVQGFMKK